MARHPRIKIVAIDIAGKPAIAACRTVAAGSSGFGHFFSSRSSRKVAARDITNVTRKIIGR
jgi:hypothetical protein